MTNNYQKPEVFEIGRAQDIVLGAKGDGAVDNVVLQTETIGGDIDESDE
jgi:hypothetical protein